MGGHSIHYVQKHAKSGELNASEIAAALVNILKCNSGDLETIKHAAYWLQRLSEDSSALSGIYESNGIPVLIKLLHSPGNLVSFCSIVIIHNLLLGIEESKAAVRKAGGLQKMLMLLNNNNKNFLCIVTNCLKILASQNPGNKFAIFFSGGPSKLVRIMETYSYETLLWTTASVLRVLSTCSINKHAIITAGGVQALVKHLNNPCQKLAMICLSTLRNLSDAANKLENMAPFLKRLIQLLGSGDMNIVCCAADILSNLTCNNPHNKVTVCRLNGVGALVNVLLRARNEKETIKPAIRSLGHLTYGHAEAETAQNGVRLHFGLPAIVEVLNPPLRWPLIKTVIGLMRNLISCPNNHKPLLALGTVRTLSDILIKGMEHISKNRERPSCYEAQSTVIDGVKMEDIVELIYWSLRRLVGKANIKALLVHSSVMNNFIKIMDRENRKNSSCNLCRCEFVYR